MHDWLSLSQVGWDCKFHVVIVPKYRKKRLYGKVRRRVGEIIKDLCRQRNMEMIEGHLMPDHVHMCLQVPPKYSFSYVIGFLKVKSAVRIHRTVLKKKRVTARRASGARCPGYCFANLTRSSSSHCESTSLAIRTRSTVTAWMTLSRPVFISRDNIFLSPPP